MFILPRQATAHMVKVRLKNSGDLIGILLGDGVWQANKKMMKKRIIFLFTCQTRRVLINTYFYDVNFLSTADVSRYLFWKGRRLNFITPREWSRLLSINEIKVKTLISTSSRGVIKFNDISQVLCSQLRRQALVYALNFITHNWSQWYAQWITFLKFFQQRDWQQC